MSFFFLTTHVTNQIIWDNCLSFFFTSWTPYCINGWFLHPHRQLLSVVTLWRGHHHKHHFLNARYLDQAFDGTNFILWATSFEHFVGSYKKKYTHQGLFQAKHAWYVCSSLSGHVKNRIFFFLFDHFLFMHYCIF